MNNDGDGYCAEKHPDWENAYCSDNKCVDEITMDGCQEEIPLGCWYCNGRYEDECSDMATGDGDPGDGDGDPGDGDGDPGDGDGDGDTPCAGPEDCTAPEAPFCDVDSGMCVNCEGTADPDGSCAGVDPATPVCNVGECVACVEGKEDACVDTTPICDLGSNACVGCSSHDQCADSACNLSAGNCFDPANIIHVSGDNLQCDDNGDGSEATPFCTLAEALINGGAEALIILHELNQGAPYAEDNVILTTTAIFAADGELPRLLGVNNNPALTVAASGELFMRGVQISGTNVVGFEVNGGSAWVDGSRIVNNTGGAIDITNGGSLTLTNSFIGGDVSDTIAVSISDGTLTSAYSTFFAGAFASAALSCTDGTGSTIRNSLLVSRSDADELACPNIEVTTSALEMAVGDNTALGPMNINWFVPTFNQGDLHLSGTHPVEIETAATWLDGDPAADIDGDARPTMDGAADFAGADLQ